MKVIFAYQRRPCFDRCVVEQISQLGFNDRPFFLDDQNFPQASRKVLDARLFNRKAKTHLVQTHTSLGQTCRGDLQSAQHFHKVVVRFSTGDDANGGVLALDDVTINAVDLRKR